jgi:NAD(P)H dehydrogenase (quinone)
MAMILVTGAAGKTGQAVIRALRKRKTANSTGSLNAVRALIHKESQIPIVEALGVQEVIVGDMGSQTTMNQAVQGVQAIYHICPNVHPQEFDIGKVMTQAAQAGNVQQFVYHSVFHPHIEAMPHHWQKMRVEAQLFESGLTTTILQPAPYMQNILAYWPEIVQNGRYFLPYAGKSRLGCVDLEDVAEVAAIVLSQSGHAGAIYELCGAASLSQNETAQMISQRLGQPVQVEPISIETWQTNARQNGLGDYQVQTLSKMFRYYEQFGYSGNSRILRCLLNRPPTNFATFIEKVVGNSAGQP